MIARPPSLCPAAVRQAALRLAAARRASGASGQAEKAVWEACVLLRDPGDSKGLRSSLLARLQGSAVCTLGRPWLGCVVWQSLGLSAALTGPCRCAPRSPAFAGGSIHVGSPPVIVADKDFRTLYCDSWQPCRLNLVREETPYRARWRKMLHIVYPFIFLGRLFPDLCMK